MTNQPLELIASCAFGLESVVRNELRQLGYDAEIVGSGQLVFPGDDEAIVRTNLWLRTADRIRIRVGRFAGADFDQLFDQTKRLPWSQWIPVDGAFPVKGRSLKSQLTSVPAVQRTVKKAIVEALQQQHQTDELPETGCSVPIEVALLNDEATLTIDTTGPSLHKRGYREKNGPAPLKETLAAALVQLSFWRSGQPLHDPFCGTGTIPIEAAMWARNIAPGLKREFVAETWSWISNDRWQRVRSEAQAAILPPLDVRLIGTDLDGYSLKLARENAERAGVADDIHFQQKDFHRITTKREYGCVITNPPYGHRIGEVRNLTPLYEALPAVLSRFETWSHFILTSFPRFEPTIQKEADRRRKLFNGRIECTYFQFHGPRAPKQPRQTEFAESDASSHTNELDRRTEIAKTEDETSAQTPTPPRGKADSQPTKPPTHARKESTSSTVRAFGGLDAKAHEQAELFAARLVKRARHLRRWPTRRGITCFRLYERDIPEVPLVVDRFEDHLHIVEFERPHERDLGQHAEWLQLMADTAAKALEIPKQHVYLKQRGRQKGKTQHEKHSEEQYEIVVHEGGLKLLANLSDYTDAGLFLDHRLTRQMVRDEAKGKRFLNLFAYTGSFSVYAADGGASETTTVDLSSVYQAWSKRNMQLNHFNGPQHRYIQSDVLSYLRRLPPKPLFDLAVIDPPTFSNSKRTEQDWEVQRDHVELLNQTLIRMSSASTLYFSTNFRRFKFEPDLITEAAEIHEISKQTVPEDFRNRRIHRCWKITR